MKGTPPDLRPAPGSPGMSLPGGRTAGQAAMVTMPSQAPEAPGVRDVCRAITAAGG